MNSFRIFIVNFIDEKYLASRIPRYDRARLITPRHSSLLTKRPQLVPILNVLSKEIYAITNRPNASKAHASHEPHDSTVRKSLPMHNLSPKG
jgi:hypothetical protein